MRALAVLFLGLVFSAQSRAGTIPRLMGTLVTEPAFMSLVTKATEELKAAERKSSDYQDTVREEKRQALVHFLANVKGKLTVDSRAEIEVQADALAKLRAEKSFFFDRVVIGTFELSKDEKGNVGVSIVLDREDVHHSPPSYAPFKTIQADLKGGYGDDVLEILNARFTN